MNRYAVGDEIAIRLTLTRNGVPDVVAGDTVAGALVLPNRSALAAGTAQVAGAIIDQAAGIVELVFPQASTGTIVPGRYLVECQITRGGKRITFDPAEATVEIYASLVT
jgi:hypothetical protein